MNKAWIIAWHQVAGALKSKVFWVSLLATPLMMVAMIFLMNAAEKSQPVLKLGLVDLTESYQMAIDRELEARHLRTFLFDYSSYFEENKSDDFRSLASQSQASQTTAEILNQLANRGRSTTYSVIDFGGFSKFKEAASQFLKADVPEFIAPAPRMIQIDIDSLVDKSLSLDEVADSLKPYLLGKPVPEQGESLDALVIIQPDNISDTPKVDYWSTNLTNDSFSNLVRDTISQSIQAGMLASAGIDSEVLSYIQNTQVNVQRFNPKAEKGKEARSAADFFKMGVPFAFAFILFMVFLIGGGVLLQSVIEEKSNKLIEVFLSSVTPGQLMAGKLLGVASVSLIVIFGLILLAVIGGFVGVLMIDQTAVVNQASQTLATANVTSEQMEVFTAAAGEVVKIIPVFIFCFVCGYIIFASLYLAVGSLCSSPQEANTLLTPLGLIMMIPMFTFGILVRDPNGTIATVMTWVPLYTPIMVLVRMSSDPPIIELLGACGLLVLMTLFMVWVSLRIFRYGVLYTGETPKMTELIRLMFSKKLDSNS